MSLNILNDQLSNNVQDYKNRRFIGTVVSIDDPLGMNRFLVNIPELNQEGGTRAWVGLEKASPFGVGPGFGVYGSPAVGSLAIIEFQDGRQTHPICVGFMLHNIHKDPRFASGSVWGYQDPSGNYLIVDMGAGTWTWHHSSGTEYDIDNSGNLSATVVGNVVINVNGNTTVNTQGNTNIETQGSTHISSGSGTTIDTTGATVINSSGSTTVSSPSVTVDSPNTVMTGMTTVQGLLRVQAGIIVTGDAGGGVAAQFTGNVNHTAGNFTSNGVTIHTHLHTTGTGDTGSPIPGT